MGTVSAPGVINSLQFISPPKGSFDDVLWARPTDGANDAPVKKAPVLLVAGIGQEQRLGRWIIVKGDRARNGAIVVALQHRTLL